MVKTLLDKGVDISVVNPSGWTAAAASGHLEVVGRDHTSTLDTVNKLGILYKDQGKLAEAEKMYERALEGYEKAWGPEHTSTLRAVNNLGLLYANQGKMAEAEKMPRIVHFWRKVNEDLQVQEEKTWCHILTGATMSRLLRNGLMVPVERFVVSDRVREM